MENSARQLSIEDVIANVRLARNLGKRIPDSEVIRENVDLQPELQSELRKLALLERAFVQAESSLERGNDDSASRLLPDIVHPLEIPDYELLRPIGLGSFGIVWLAQNRHDNQRYAVKTLHDGEETELNGIREFKPRSEANPYVVPIGHVGVSDETYYYVMPLADDSNDSQPVSWVEAYEPMTLELYVQRRGKLSPEVAAEIINDVLMGLKLLHAAGAVHRDVKPSNILRFGGRWKLGDPGLLCDDSDDNANAGTKGFRPPEGSSRPTVDLYATGKTLADIVGYNAEHSNSNNERQALLTQVIDKACREDPKQRFVSAEEFQQALQPLLKRSPFAKRSVWVSRAIAGLMAFLAFFVFRSMVTSENPSSAEVAAATEVCGISVCEPAIYDVVDRSHQGTLGMTIHEAQADDGIQFNVQLDRAGFVYVIACSNSSCGVVYPEEDYVDHDRRDKFAYPDGRAFPVSNQQGFDLFVVVSATTPIPSLGEWVTDNVKNVWQREGIEEQRSWTYDGIYRPYFKATRSDPREFDIDTAPDVMKQVVALFETMEDIDDVWAIGFPVKDRVVNPLEK